MRVKHRPSFICDRKGEKFLQVLIFRQKRSDLGSKGHSDVLQILNIINVFIPCLNRVLGIMFGLVSKEAKKIVHISLMHLVQKILRIAFNHFFIELFLLR